MVAPDLLPVANVSGLTWDQRGVVDDGRKIGYLDEWMVFLT